MVLWYYNNRDDQYYIYKNGNYLPSTTGLLTYRSSYGHRQTMGCPAAEKFDYPVDMDVRELISLDDATEEVIDLGPNGCLIYYICMESPEDIYENLEKYFGDDSHEFDCFPDIKELISMDDDMGEKEIGLWPKGCLIYRMKNLEDTLDNCCHEQLENYFDDDSQEFDCFPGAVSWPALPRAPFASSPGYSQGAHRRITMPRVGVQAAPSASSRHRRSHNVVARALPRASFVSVPGTLDKDLVRLCLTRQENIIFYNFLERSEFCLNPESYNIESCKILGFSGTLMEYIIQETEKSHARAGRYKHQGEVPFFAEILLEPRFPVLEHHEGLDYGGVMSVNLNEMIWHCYFNRMLPQLVKKGTDGNNGLAAECDSKVLQETGWTFAVLLVACECYLFGLLGYPGGRARLGC